MKSCESKALELGMKKVIIQSRECANGFYEKLNYKLIEKSYLLFEKI